MAARKTKLAPRLTVVKGNRQHWGLRLDKFRVNYGLSVRDLVQVLENTLRKSALHDVLSGECAPRMEAVIKPTIAGHLRKYLKTKHKKSALEIEREMLEIFHEPICNKEIETVLTERRTLPKSVQTYFGLRFDPFTVDPRNRSEVFTTPQLDKISNQLEDAINYQQFVAVIGEIGAGKSLTKRRIVDSCLNSKGKMQIFWPEFMSMGKVHSGSVSAFLLHKFGQKVPRNLVEQADRLKEQLALLSDEGVRVALGFDECHRLDPRFLTELKNFYELGSGGYDRYLGLILFGQPRFESTLRNVEFREITERLDIIHLPNLGKNAFDYVAHRIKSAGGNAEKLFDRDVITKLGDIGPTPLALGNLCNAALLKAQQLGEKKVHKGMLKAAGLFDDGEPKVRGISRAS
jgi:type II secretory pathway predicted ATPase ExeA